ncbi:PrsW family intramembrane metalloprotease [Glaciibacter sp. 2TAF33]|uniref:PrsW family intramembrane metalloprotease n=1 Tax=Glaciibacter sp. 2TAF33 TaxID=3233015 RepID=UPI003F8E12A8
MSDNGGHYLHPAPHPVQPVWTGEVRQSRAGPIVLAIAGILIGGIALLVVFVYLASFLGTGGLLLSLAFALIPLAAVLWAVRWIDRWDPEPRPALWFAFLWGAGVAIVTALLFDLGVQLAILAATGGAPGQDGAGRNDFLAAVVQAPIVEESAKGFGILLLFWGMRKHFDGPVDGVVFAATIAAGFAFTENIQYFGVALAEGGFGSLGLTFVVRGLFSPFAHVMFTACTGLALGLAAGRTGPIGAIGYYLAGLVPAVLLHALWNGAFTLFAADTSLIAYYLLVQVPLFIAAIVVVVLLRRQEVRVTGQRLGDYAAAGWFTPAEVAMLATPAGRRQARAWAAKQPPATRAAMRRFITDATRLAFARNRLVNGSARQVSRADESALLGRVLADRAAVLG